jgi:tRNA (guanine37-N1)-methyltransferase
MKFSIITLFPDMVSQALTHGVLGQAFKKDILKLEIINPREFSADVHRTVDDRPFGGGDGMLLQAEVVRKSIEKAKAENPEAPVIYLSPQGKTLNEEKVQELVKHKSLILLTARYGGIDQRLINRYVDEEISIGDYVLSGGELPALVVVETVARKIPGVLGHQESAEKDSFANGLLEAPLFTRPQIWDGKGVPETLMSGHHGLIEKWRDQMSWLITFKKRPDLFKAALEKKYPDSERRSAQLKTLKEFYKSRGAEELEACGLPPYSEEVFGGW